MSPTPVLPKTEAAPVFAVVAPLHVTSDLGETRLVLDRLQSHLHPGPIANGSSHETEATPAASTRLYVGLVPAAASSSSMDEGGQERLQLEILARNGKAGALHVATFGPGDGGGTSVTTTGAIWEALGTQAFQDGADYVVLWHSATAAFSIPTWQQVLVQDFAELARVLAASAAGAEATADKQHGIHGFGCVALLAEDRPRDRFQLALHRTHFELLDGHVVPPSWEQHLGAAGNGGGVESDVDRRLYYTYAKLNVARVSSRCGLLFFEDGQEDGVMTMTTSASATTKACRRRRTLIDDKDATLQTLGAHLAARLGCSSVPALLRALPPSMDVVTPTYRVDMGLLQGICGTAGANQGSLTYVVVDDPRKVRPEAVAGMQRRLSLVKPAIVRVNAVNSGVTYSRNRGIELSGADWVVFQDDDVVPDPNLLRAYSEAIVASASNARKEEEEHPSAPGPPPPPPPPPVGLCGMIHFPEPYNTFTAALRMSGVTNAFEIAELTPLPVWGCTANVCMRNGPWLHFSEDWEKTGGGEDIDFFLRLREVGASVVSAPAAAVTHPWWTEGRRSYWHFRMWGLGDGRLQKLYPEHCYRSCPCSVETLAFLLVAAVAALAASWTVGGVFPSFLLSLLLLAIMGILEVDMVGNVLCDRLLLRPVGSESLAGWRRIWAAMEAAFILGASELGRLQYHLCHPKGRLRDVGVRFDFYCGKIPEARRAWKITYALKFLGFLGYGVAVQAWWLSAGKGASIGRSLSWLLVGLAHAGFLAFVGAMFVVA